MSTFSIFIALIIVVCFLLVLVVMVQNPKGGGLSSSFGGGSQQVGGVQKTSDFLDRSTWILASLLLILILISNVTLTPGSTSQDSKLLKRGLPSKQFQKLFLRVKKLFQSKSLRYQRFQFLKRIKVIIAEHTTDMLTFISTSCHGNFVWHDF